MNTKPRFICDVDSVVADFVTVYLDIVRFLGLRPGVVMEDVHLWDVGQALHLNETELEAVHQHLYIPGVAGRLPVIPGSVEGILSIAEITDFWFATAPLNANPTWEFERRHWVKTHLSYPLSKRVCNVPEKYLVGGDFFLDDKPSNALKYAEAHPNSTVFLWETPWTWVNDKTLEDLETELVKVWTRAADPVELRRVKVPGRILITKSWEVVHGLVTLFDFREH